MTASWPWSGRGRVARTGQPGPPISSTLKIWPGTPRKRTRGHHPQVGNPRAAAAHRGCQGPTPSGFDLHDDVLRRRCWDSTIECDEILPRVAYPDRVADHAGAAPHLHHRSRCGRLRARTDPRYRQTHDNQHQRGARPLHQMTADQAGVALVKRLEYEGISTRSPTSADVGFCARLVPTVENERPR